MLFATAMAQLRRDIMTAMFGNNNALAGGCRMLRPLLLLMLADRMGLVTYRSLQKHISYRRPVANGVAYYKPCYFIIAEVPAVVTAILVIASVLFYY